MHKPGLAPFIQRRGRPPRAGTGAGCRRRAGRRAPPRSGGRPTPRPRSCQGWRRRRAARTAGPSSAPSASASSSAARPSLGRRPVTSTTASQACSCSRSVKTHDVTALPAPARASARDTETSTPISSSRVWMRFCSMVFTVHADTSGSGVTSVTWQPSRREELGEHAAHVVVVVVVDDARARRSGRRAREHVVRRQHLHARRELRAAACASGRPRRRARCAPVATAMWSNP